MKMFFKSRAAKQRAAKRPIMKTFNKMDFKSALALALLPGVILMVLQHIFITFNVYSWYFPNLDIFMHIMGGASVAWAAWALSIYAMSVKKLPKLPFWFMVAFAVGVAAMVGVLWEHYEFLHDAFLNTNEQLAQFGVSDTMKDFADDLIGALLLSVLVGRKMLKK